MPGGRFGDVLAWECIVAIGFLTQRELDLLGPSFTRAWPLDESPCFAELIRAIDEADKEVGRLRMLRAGPLRNRRLWGWLFRCTSPI